MSAVVVPSRATTPRANSAAVNPTAAADVAAGYRVGDKWINTVTGNSFWAVSVAAGAAVWRHYPRLLASSATAVSCPADTTEDILGTVTVPAGAMGLNGILRIWSVWTMTSSGNNKIPRIRLGGIGGTAHLATTQTAVVSMTDVRVIQNVASASVQKSGNSNLPAVGLAGGAVTAGALDTSASTTLVFTGQKASAGETLTLEAYTVELILPDITA